MKVLFLNVGMEMEREGSFKVLWYLESLCGEGLCEFADKWARQINGKQLSVLE